MSQNYQLDSPYHRSIFSPGAGAAYGQQQQQQQHQLQHQQNHVSHIMHRQGGPPPLHTPHGSFAYQSHNATAIGVQSPAPMNAGMQNFGVPINQNYVAGVTNLDNSFALAEILDKNRCYMGASLSTKIFTLDGQQMKADLCPPEYNAFDEEVKNRHDQDQKNIDDLQAKLNREKQAAEDLKRLNLEHQSNHELSKIAKFTNRCGNTHGITIPIPTSNGQQFYTGLDCVVEERWTDKNADKANYDYLNMTDTVFKDGRKFLEADKDNREKAYKTVMMIGQEVSRFTQNHLQLVRQQLKKSQEELKVFDDIQKMSKMIQIGGMISPKLYVDIKDNALTKSTRAFTKMCLLHKMYYDFEHEDECQVILKANILFMGKSEKVDGDIIQDTLQCKITPDQALGALDALKFCLENVAKSDYCKKIKEMVKEHCKDAVEKKIVFCKEILFEDRPYRWDLKSIDIYSTWEDNNKALCSFLAILSGALSDEIGNTSFSGWNPHEVNFLNKNGGWERIDDAKVFGKQEEEKVEVSIDLENSVDVEMAGNEESEPKSRKRPRVESEK